MNRVFVLFLIVIFYSCDRKSDNNINGDSITRIDLLTEPESTIKKLSEIATTVEYIPLQTTENSFITSFVLKIVNKDDRIYIQNSQMRNEILCFNRDGKFLFKLQNSGRGPEEYTFISDFDVSSDNKSLTILSVIDHKLLFYGISDTGFAFHRSIKLGDPVPDNIGLVPETDNIFLAIGPWRGDAPTLSLLINSVVDTIHFKQNCYKYKNVKKIGSRSRDELLTYSIGNRVCFKEVFRDTVFCVDAKDNSFKPRIIFDSHGTLITPEMRGGSEPVGKNTIFISSIFETPRYVIYYRSHLRNMIFDKINKVKYELNIKNVNETIANTSFETPKTVLIDDLSGGPDFHMNINLWNILCSNGKLFSLVDAITLKNYIASGDFNNVKVSDSKKAELKKLADSLIETDNPVLVMVTPKN